MEPSAFDLDSSSARTWLERADAHQAPVAPEWEPLEVGAENQVSELLASAQ